jgi:hypothetical protein
MGNLEFLKDGHSDLHLEWHADYAGSVAMFRQNLGAISMKYSGVPYFLYILAKPLRSLEFLGGQTIGEIARCKRVSFAERTCERLVEEVEESREDQNRMLIGWYEDSGGRKVIEPTLLAGLRERFELSGVIETLSAKGISIDLLEGRGIVPASDQYEHPVHCLFADGMNYAAQQQEGKGSIVRLDNKETQRIVEKIVRGYGTPVSGALASLLKKT